MGAAVLLAGLVACDDSAQSTSTAGDAAGTASAAAGSAAAGSAGQAQAPQADAKSEFRIVDTNGIAEVRQLGDRVVLGNEYWLSKDGMQQDYALRKGVYNGAVPRWFGSFPHAAWVQHYLEMGGCCTRVSHHYFTYRWYGDHFERRHTYKNNERLLAISAPSKELAFALVGNEPQARLFPIHEDAKLTAALSPLEGAKVVKQSREVSEPPKVPGCKTVMRVDAVSGDAQRPLLVLPDGHIFVAGKSCWDAGKSLLAEVFAPAETNGTVYDVAPSREPVITYAGDHQPILVGSAKDSVYLLQRGTTSLHHFNGKGWEMVEVPQHAPIHDLNVGKDGVLWIASDSGLYRRERDAWKKVMLPVTGAVRPLPTSVALHPDGSVWVVAQAGATKFVLTTADVDWVHYLQTCKTLYLEVDVEYPKRKVDLEAVGRQLAKVPGARELKFGLDDGTHGRHVGAVIPNLDLGRHLKQEIESIEKHIGRLMCATREHDLEVKISIAEGEKPTAPPPPLEPPVLNNKLVTFQLEKLPPVGIPSEGTSPKPGPYSWGGATMVDVVNARSLGCTVRTQKEWVRFDCSGIGEFKLDKGPSDRKALVLSNNVIVAALRPGLNAEIKGTSESGEPRTLTLRYDEGAPPKLAFDKPASSTAVRYPLRYLERSKDMVKLPAGKGPNGDVKAFYIDRTKVSVSSLVACANQGKCELGKTSKCWKTGWSEQPEGSSQSYCVSHAQAATFCASRGKRLPTADEWLYAAFGKGDDTIPRLGFGGGVGQHPAMQSRFGVFDMSAGVAEWTSTEADGKFLVLGTKNDNNYGVQLTLDRLLKNHRTALAADTRSKEIGFRCAKDDS